MYAVLIEDERHIKPKVVLSYMGHKLSYHHVSFYFSLQLLVVPSASWLPLASSEYQLVFDHCAVLVPIPFVVELPSADSSVVHFHSLPLSGLPQPDSVAFSLALASVFHFLVAGC